MQDPWPATFAPCDGRELCALLAAAVRKDLLAFCKSHGRFMPCVSAIPPPRVFSAARLSLRIPLLAVPSRTQCSHANAAMYRSPVLFWQRGQPLLVLCSPALLVTRCLFMRPAGTLSSSSGDGGKLLRRYSIISFLCRMAWEVCINSLSVLHARTAFHLPCRPHLPR